MFRACLLWLLCGTSAFAVEIHLEADNKTLQEGESVGLYLSIVDGMARGTPRLPIVDGLSIVSRGRRQSLVSINGKPTRTITYTYALTGLQAGEYDVPAFSVNVNGQAYNTQPLHFTVNSRDAASKGGIQAGFNQEKMWVGQTVIYRLSLRVPGRILQSRWSPPLLEGFSPEQSLAPTQREYNTQLEGQNWGVLELDTPLIATRAGARQVPAGMLQVELPARKGRRVSLFTETRTEVFPTPPLEVAVHPLPEEGRLPVFSGLVGDFTLSVRLSKDRVAAGESTTLSIFLEGDGSLAGFSLPALTDASGFAAYDDEPEFQARMEDGNFLAEAVLKRAIVPEREGLLQLPPIQVQTFSPSTGGYELLEGPVFEIEVLPGDGEVQADRFGSEDLLVKAPVLEDIQPFRPKVDLSSDVFRVTPLLLAVGGVPWFLWLALFSKDRVSSIERKEDPRRDLKKRIRRAHRLPVGELESLFRDCAGLAIGRPPAGLRSVDLEQGLSGALKEEALLVYKSLEAARYGSGAAVDPKRAQACMRQLLEARR